MTFDHARPQIPTRMWPAWFDVWLACAVGILIGVAIQNGGC